MQSIVSQPELTSGEADALYRTMGGHIYFQTLSAAVRLKLFDWLADRGPSTNAEIAKALGIAEKPARILLLGCTTLGLLAKRGDRYANANVASALLVRDAPGNIVSVIEWQHFINYRAMFWFYDAIVANANVGLQEFPGNEPALYGRLAHDPNLERIFQNAMHDISVQANELLCRSIDFSDVEHVVDVGGGNGTNAMRLAEEHPHLRVTVFDSPSVCQIATENIRRSGFQDRVDAIAGNCFRDPFPSGADCLLFCHFLTIWSEDKNQFLLKKAYDALTSGGQAIVFNMMQSDDGTGPLSAAMGAPYFLTLATGEGMMYSWSEYEAWMREAGFEKVSRQELPKDHGAIIGVKK